MEHYFLEWMMEPCKRKEIYLVRTRGLVWQAQLLALQEKILLQVVSMVMYIVGDSIIAMYLNPSITDR